MRLSIYKILFSPNGHIRVWSDEITSSVITCECRIAIDKRLNLFTVKPKIGTSLWEDSISRVILTTTERIETPLNTGDPFRTLLEHSDFLAYANHWKATGGGGDNVASTWAELTGKPFELLSPNDFLTIGGMLSINSTTWMNAATINNTFRVSDLLAGDHISLIYNSEKKEYTIATKGSAEWGKITGDLWGQLDLKAVLEMISSQIESKANNIVAFLGAGASQFPGDVYLQAGQGLIVNYGAVNDVWGLPNAKQAKLGINIDGVTIMINSQKQLFTPPSFDRVISCLMMTQNNYLRLRGEMKDDIVVTGHTSGSQFVLDGFSDGEGNVYYSDYEHTFYCIRIKDLQGKLLKEITPSTITIDDSYAPVKIKQGSEGYYAELEYDSSTLKVENGKLAVVGGNISSIEWGQITGPMSSQTDLWTVLGNMSEISNHIVNHLKDEYLTAGDGIAISMTESPIDGYPKATISYTGSTGGEALDDLLSYNIQRAQGFINVKIKHDTTTKYYAFFLNNSSTLVTLTSSYQQEGDLTEYNNNDNSVIFGDNVILIITKQPNVTSLDVFDITKIVKYLTFYRYENQYMLTCSDGTIDLDKGINAGFEAIDLRIRIDNSTIKVNDNDQLYAVGGAGTWGNIAGTLSNQTDLKAALDNKLDKERRNSDGNDYRSLAKWNYEVTDYESCIWFYATHSPEGSNFSLDTYLEMGNGEFRIFLSGLDPDFNNNWVFESKKGFYSENILYVPTDPKSYVQKGYIDTVEDGYKVKDLIAGDNITLTYNSTDKEYTIASTGGGGGGLDDMITFNVNWQAGFISILIKHDTTNKYYIYWYDGTALNTCTSSYQEAMDVTDYSSSLPVYTDTSINEVPLIITTQADMTLENIDETKIVKNIASYRNSGGSSSWGSITGTLSDQTDLQHEIDELLAKTYSRIVALPFPLLESSPNYLKVADEITITDEQYDMLSFYNIYWAEPSDSTIRKRFLFVKRGKENSSVAPKMACLSVQSTMPLVKWGEIGGSSVSAQTDLVSYIGTTITNTMNGFSFDWSDDNYWNK